MTDNKTKGAWIVHHAQKLSTVASVGRLDNLSHAGKAIVLLSALAETERENDIDKHKLDAIATGCGINKKTELPTLLKTLADEKVVDLGKDGGCSVLGVTSQAALVHGANIFNKSDPTKEEIASIEFAETLSSKPLRKDEAEKLLSDACGLLKADSSEFLNLVSSVGIVDKEGKSSEELYFNGNIFRRNFAQKAKLILSSLSQNELTKVKDAEGQIDAQGCLELTSIKKILGEELWSKLNSIGYFDQTSVENSTESVIYVTRPASFSKFGNGLIEDALDLAKALTVSLTYGMTRSASGRGRINYIEALMKKLLSGEWVGPATAIGQDYQILEIRRVIELEKTDGGMYKMRLRKKDVGEIALAALRTGAPNLTAISLTGASITSFTGPETNRTAERLKQIGKSKKETKDILEALRTGG